MGHGNHKVFFLFLLYTTGACAHAVALLLLKAVFFAFEARKA